MSNFAKDNKDNDSNNFHYNLADVNYTEEKTLGSNVQNQLIVLHQITTLRTSIPGNFRPST